MKKRLLALFLCMTMALSMTACGGSEGESVENTEGTEEQVSDLAKYEFNYADYVNLCDYHAIPVELYDVYDVTDEDVKNYISEFIASYAPYYSFFVPDETKTVIEAGDIVDVNYVGKLDGVAFEGGTAYNQLIDVSNNCMANYQTGFIDGFTDGLLGAEVGAEVDCDVTFPEDYGSEELAGKDVVFTFTVNAIQRVMTYEDLDDTFAQTYFEEETVDGLFKTTKENMIKMSEVNKATDTNEEILWYLLDNCTVDIPADYFADLMEAFRNDYILNNCEGDEAKLEEFLSTNYNCTVEEAEDEWREYLTLTVKQEFIVCALAQELGLELDAEGFEAMIAEAVSQNGLESEKTLFEAYGYGDAAYGEVYMKRTFLGTDVLEKLTETAVITMADPETASVETSEQ